MKKILIIILCTFCISISNAKTLKYKAIGYSHCETGKSFSDWTNCDIDVFINWDKHRVKIMSQNPQVINYSIPKRTEADKEFFVSKARVTNSKYKNMYISFYVHNNKDAFIVIEHSNVKYMYKIDYVK